MLPVPGDAMYFDRQGSSWVRSAMSKAGILINGEHLVDEGAPAQNTELLPVVIEQRHRFLFAINVQRFAVVFAGGSDGKFHREVSAGLQCIDLLRSGSVRRGGLVRLARRHALYRMDQIQDAIAGLRCDIRETHSHPGAKCVLVRFRADPGNHSLCRHPLGGIFREGEFHCQFGSDSQWGDALNKETAAADSSGSTLEVHSIGSVIFDADRKGNPWFGTGLTGLLRFSIGQNLIDKKIPPETSHWFAVEAEQRDRFLGGINFKRLTLVS